jgi:hypothetical protein
MGDAFVGLLLILRKWLVQAAKMPGCTAFYHIIP